MKKYLLFLFLLLALHAPALATDVTISAMTVDGFSPSSIGSDRQVAVSTAGGSPTVTSAAQFPLGIVGIGGFTVRIDGALYTVASVASTSSLTLATNYAGTPGAQVMTLFKYVELRVYADRAFQPLGSAQIVQPGTVGSGAYFRRFAASVVNNGSTDQLFIPQIVLPATTDALITNQARYTIPLYRPGGSLVQSFFCPSSLAQLRLPPATPTTWTAVCQFNSASAIAPPSKVAYSTSEIDNRFPSCSINQAIYYAASGNKQSCLTIGSGLSISGGVLTAGAGGGYATIQEEGGGLTQRTILNFIGAGFTAADNAGATRTELSLDPDLNALSAFGGTGIPARTAADTWLLRSLTQPAAGLTITNPAGVAGNPTFALANDLAGLEGLGTNGIPARTAADTWAIRTLTQPAAGLTITNPGGVAGNPTFALANDLSALEGLGGDGFSARTAADTWAVRTLVQPAAGLTITNPAGTAGDPTFALANDLSAVEGLSTTGIAARTASDTWTTRTITGTTNRIEVTNGNGVSGNPTLDIGSDVVTLTGTQTLTNKTLTSPRIGTSILDTNGAELFTLTATGSAVNEVSIANAATGITGPTIGVSGSTTDVNLNINAKGTGRVVIKGYPFTLEVNTATTASTGAGPDTLHSFSLPANSLDNNGDYVEVEYAFIFAADDDNKAIRATFGGQEYMNRGLGSTDLDGILGGVVRATITRLTSTTVLASATLVGNLLLGDSANVFTGTSGNGGIMFGSVVVLTVADLDANATTMAGQSLGVNAGDVTQRLSVIKLVQR